MVWYEHTSLLLKGRGGYHFSSEVTIADAFRLATKLKEDVVHQIDIFDTKPVFDNNQVILKKALRILKDSMSNIMTSDKILVLKVYEGCSNMNASSFITFATYMLRQIGIRFYKGFIVTFKLAPDRNKNTVNLSSYSPLNEGRFSILTNSMLRKYQ